MWHLDWTSKQSCNAVLPQLASTEICMDVGNQHPDWLVNEGALSGWDQLCSQMRRLMPQQREEKPNHNQKVEVMYASMKNSIDAAVKNGIQAHNKYVDFRQIMAITNWAKQLAKASCCGLFKGSQGTYLFQAHFHKTGIYNDQCPLFSKWQDGHKASSCVQTSSTSGRVYRT